MWARSNGSADEPSGLKIQPTAQLSSSQAHLGLVGPLPQTNIINLLHFKNLVPLIYFLS